MTWIEALPQNRRRGSYPRCLQFMEGDCAEVAQRLTTMVDLEGIAVNSDDFWMPSGPPVRGADGEWDRRPAKEAKLGEIDGLLPAELREEVTAWWLEVRPSANTPNWDIASTCTVSGKPGLLLVEAKAHATELSCAGKTRPATPNGWKNHEKIGRAIAEANAALNELRAGWALSRDSHYQLSNRYAWAWKLASLGVPVVLVYLGFLNADEMADRGEPFRMAQAWAQAVQTHSQGIVPDNTWGQDIDVGGVPLWPLIRSTRVDLQPHCGTGGQAC